MNCSRVFNYTEFAMIRNSKERPSFDDYLYQNIITVYKLNFLVYRSYTNLILTNIELFTHSTFTQCKEWYHDCFKKILNKYFKILI